MPDWARPSFSRFFLTLTVWLIVWFLPLAALVALLGRHHVLAAEAIFFSKMAAVTFGGAYAVLVYAAQQAVGVAPYLS